MRISWETVWACLIYVVNLIVYLVCSVWLFQKRKLPKIIIAQPLFLGLVLAGCFISSSSIVALIYHAPITHVYPLFHGDNEDLDLYRSGSGSDSGVDRRNLCMAIPWLYSVGFCISTGTAFAKIGRIRTLFMSAAEMRRKVVDVSSTLRVIGVMLMLDVLLLVLWTLLDPLQWEETVTDVDAQTGQTLQSVHFCTSSTWGWNGGGLFFGGLMLFYHLILMTMAGYMCYATRQIPSTMHEGNCFAMALVSNFQVLLVGVPVLIQIRMSDPDACYFLQTTIVWINDLALVLILFGHLMASIRNSNPACSRAAAANIELSRSIHESVAKYSSRHSSRHHRRGGSGAGSGGYGNTFSNNNSTGSGRASRFTNTNTNTNTNYGAGAGASQYNSVGPDNASSDISVPSFHDDAVSRATTATNHTNTTNSNKLSPQEQQRQQELQEFHIYHPQSPPLLTDYSFGSDTENPSEVDISNNNNNHLHSSSATDLDKVGKKIQPVAAIATATATTHDFPKSNNTNTDTTTCTMVIAESISNRRYVHFTELGRLMDLYLVVQNQGEEKIQSEHDKHEAMEKQLCQQRSETDDNNNNNNNDNENDNYNYNYNHNDGTRKEANNLFLARIRQQQQSSNPVMERQQPHQQRKRQKEDEAAATAAAISTRTADTMVNNTIGSNQYNNTAQPNSINEHNNIMIMATPPTVAVLLSETTTTVAAEVVPTTTTTATATMTTTTAAATPGDDRMLTGLGGLMSSTIIPSNITFISDNPVAIMHSRRAYVNKNRRGGKRRA